LNSLKKNLAEGILQKIPHPDSDPRKRAKRIADKITTLDDSEINYTKTKLQLQKVIFDVLQKLPDKQLANSLYNELCPTENDFDDDEDELVQNWDENDDNDDICYGELEEAETITSLKIETPKKPTTKTHEKKKNFTY